MKQFLVDFTQDKANVIRVMRTSHQSMNRGDPKDMTEHLYFNTMLMTISL